LVSNADTKEPIDFIRFETTQLNGTIAAVDLQILPEDLFISFIGDQIQLQDRKEVM
jgi:hypothetical protein